MKLLTSKELEEKINSGEKFLVDMYADWCGPCKILGPIMERANVKLENEGHEVKLYKFDIESDKELAMTLGIRSIPTVMGFSGGELKTTNVGVLQESQIINIVNSL